ncbi:lipocalin-like domain-containing protein [Spirosoma fluviale]|uniref:Lipocalin-like domain-containing protein n=1 Tax=Spirosoma fluviale TaxID=1597977 RepID=A0A286GMU0_9BACT|nr:lipocalin family protein [Spirosoma fluviale]SOD96304.1 Lipocalin-like domain-containing protein [Spirosoma fluviale]
MKHLILLLVTFATLSCSQSDSGLLPNGLVGTWQLISYCKPTSSSTCTPITVPADKGVFISFDNRGQFNESYQNTKPIEYSFLGCGGGSFTIEGDSLRIRAVCMSSINGQLIRMVSVTNSQLILNPSGTSEYVFSKR